MTAEWFVKVTGMLVQNWATISVETALPKFILSRVCFDRLDYDCASEARNKLARNGFHPVDFENKTDYSAAICPKKVLHEGRGSNQPIYSSGEYGKW